MFFLIAQTQQTLQESKFSELRKYLRETKNSALVLYGFDTCEPCQQTKEVLKELQTEFDGQVGFFYMNCQGQHTDVKRECFKHNMTHLPLLWLYNSRHPSQKKPVNYDYHMYLVGKNNITSFILNNMHLNYDVVTEPATLNALLTEYKTQQLPVVYVFQIFDEVSSKFQKLAAKYDSKLKFVFIIDFDSQQLGQVEDQQLLQQNIESNSFNLILYQNDQYTKYDGQQIVDKIDSYLQSQLPQSDKSEI